MTRLTKNIAYNVVGQGLVLVLSLIAVRFIFRRLGDDVFGIIFFNLVLTSVLVSALELGISATIVREVSSYFDKDRQYVKALIGTASLLYWGLGFVLVGVIWVTAPLLVTHWVNLKSLDPGTAATILRILSATTMVSLPKTLYTSVFRGRQMMALNNTIDVATSAAQQAGILLLLLAGGRVYVVAGWISTSVILGIIAYVLVAAHLVGWSTLKPTFSLAVVRRTLGFTSHMMVISITSLLHTQAAQVIVSKLLPIAEFGFFGFASSTVNRATFVTTSVSQAAFPALASLFAAGDRPALMRQYRKLQDLVCYGTLPLFAGICFAAVPVYTYVFNSTVAHGLLLPTAFLALGIWMNATISIPYILSVAMGKPQIAARQNVYALIVVLPATTALILRFGIVGASLSLVIYHVFAYAYMVPRICRLCLDAPVASWYLQVLKVAGLGALTYVPTWLALNLINLSSLPAAVLAFAVGTAAFAGGAYLLIDPDLRQTIQRLPQSLIASRTSAI
ncbi:MAG: oligosaccharide flippase family protein [Candidatus Dormibacteraceae bacterium]